MTDEPIAAGAGTLADWRPVGLDPSFADIVPASARLVHQATGAIWSEGPVWLAADGAILWSDIPNDRVLRWSPDAAPAVFLAPAGFQNGHSLDLDGSILACSHGDRRIERLSLDGTRVPVVDRFRGARLNSPNDLVVKSDGTIWFTDPMYGIESDREGHRAESEIGDCLVFRHDPATGELDAVSDWLEHPNGIAFSPDESTLYVSDTSGARLPGGNHHIVAFDVIDGRRLADPRIFYVAEPGLADGFRLDEHGNLFTSAGDGIHVVAPDGRLLGRMPVPEVASNCVFGGRDGRTLFITATTSLYSVGLAVRGATRPR
ncbi:MAG: SMP-30/gluconolactonase/LRE family protein [Chloroflexi bacterium]|nr:SMP-30/gluconolactonase/LRE family protein [Chloroflexota bacterium]